MPIQFKKELFITSALSLFLSFLLLKGLIPFFDKGIPYCHTSPPECRLMDNVQGDHLQWLYHLNLLEKAIQGKVPFFSEGFQFETPYKLHTPNLFFPPQGLLYYLFSFLGYAGSYNFLIFLSLITSMITTFAYLRQLGASGIGSFAGGLIFTFFPYRMAVLMGGHPAGMFIAYLPFFLLCLDMTLLKGSLLASFFAGATLFCMAAEPHYHYYLCLFLPFYLILIYGRSLGNIALPSLRIQDFLRFLVKETRPFFFNALISFFVFTMTFAARRPDSVLWQSLVLTALFAPLIFLAILLPGFWIYRLFHATVFDLKMKRIFNFSLLSFSFFYLYLIQLHSNIESLASLLSLLSLSFFYAPLLFSADFASLRNLGRSFRERAAFLKPTLRKIVLLFPLFLFALLSLWLLLAIKSSTIDSSMVDKGRKIAEIKLFSPSLNDLLKPENGVSSKYVYPGLTALFLGLWSMVACLRRIFKKGILEKELMPVLFYLPVFLLTFILAFGPNVSMPPLFEMARKFIPCFSYIRSPIKIILFSSLSLSVIAGYFCLAVNRSWIKALIILALFGEYYYLEKNYGICLLKNESKVLSTLKNEQNPGKVLYLPLWPGNSSWESLYQYYSILTDRRMINGYQPVVSRGYVNNVVEGLSSLNIGKIGKEEALLLKNLGITDVVFDLEAVPRKVSPLPVIFSIQGLSTTPYLKLAEYSYPLYLFKFLENPDSTQRPPLARSSAFGIVLEGEAFEPSQGVHNLRDKDFSGGLALSFPEGQANAILKRTLPEGHFKGFVRVKSGEGSDLKMALILRKKGKETGAALLLPKDAIHDPDGSERVPFSLEIPETASYELTLEKQGKAVSLDYLYLIFENEMDPKREIGPDDGIFRGERIDGPEGKIIEIDEDKCNTGTAFLGPNRFFEAGNYEALFEIRGEFPPSEEPALKIEATNSQDSQVFSDRLLFTKDFSEKGWKTFPLKVTLPTSRIMNFHVRFEGRGKLWFKKISVTRKE